MKSLKVYSLAIPVDLSGFDLKNKKKQIHLDAIYP